MCRVLENSLCYLSLYSGRIQLLHQGGGYQGKAKKLGTRVFIHCLQSSKGLSACQVNIRWVDSV
jgi:hypothetical protein